jgi:hypothetical protein
VLQVGDTCVQDAVEIDAHVVLVVDRHGISGGRCGQCQRGQARGQHPAGAVEVACQHSVPLKVFLPERCIQADISSQKGRGTANPAANATAPESRIAHQEVT